MFYSNNYGMYEQPMKHISLKKGQAQKIRKVTHCAGHVEANTRPHQLYWGGVTRHVDYQRGIQELELYTIQSKGHLPGQHVPQYFFVYSLFLHVDEVLA